MTHDNGIKQFGDGVSWWYFDHGILKGNKAVLDEYPRCSEGILEWVALLIEAPSSLEAKERARVLGLDVERFNQAAASPGWFEVFEVHEFRWWTPEEFNYDYDPDRMSCRAVAYCDDGSSRMVVALV